MTELDDGLVHNPILNSPYHEPGSHWPFDEDTGIISGDPVAGRRPSAYLTPIPGAKAGINQQLRLGVSDEETIQRNVLINDIRGRVKVWRNGIRPWDGVTATTRKLLEHWAVVDDRPRPLFFAQREAIETAIWLTEVAPKEAPHIVDELAQFGLAVSDGLPRIAHKMATGTGKTVLMSLIIAWHTLNKAARPQDARFTDQFLVVSPGITIRDRLRVLSPSDENNYYDSLGLIPVSMRDELSRATVVIINYHQLMLRQKVSLNATTKAILGADAENYRETFRGMVARVLRPFGKRRTEIVVLNDEAHHCWRPRPTNVQLDPDVARRGFRVTATTQDDGVERSDDDDARRWHEGLTAINAHRGIKTVYDLSATPFYLSGSGWPEGTLFQWVVSDFPLIEAIESGLVKVPRVPVRDDVNADDPAFRALWVKIGAELRRVRGKQAREGEPVIPADLEAAFRALYDDYRQHYAEVLDGREDDPDVTPPVFIVVADTTDRSNYLYRWMAGWRDTDGVLRHGVAPLFDNVDCDNLDHHTADIKTANVACAAIHDPRLRPRPLSLLVDSQALDTPNAQMPRAFVDAAKDELESFRREYSLRNPCDEPDDAEILREVMNTVGDPDRLGGPIRLVVSVSMLTEGWDANTVTHILGVRAFSTQLICEQVVGRALRRVSYEIGEDGNFPPEYADIYGVPWKLIPTAGKRETDSDPNPSVRIHPIPERATVAEITFPRVVGYRVKPPDEQIAIDHWTEHASMTIEQATWAEVVDVTGHGRVASLAELARIRRQQVAFDLAHRVTEKMVAGAPAAAFDAIDPDDPGRSETIVGSRPWLFPQILRVVRRWLDECLTLKGNTTVQYVLLSQHRNEAVDRILGQIADSVATRGQAVILPVLSPHGTIGSTGQMQIWSTSRDPDLIHRTDADKCHINRVVGHSGWEKRLAAKLEDMPDVMRYVKNDHLDFTVPYVLDGLARSYTPDFIVHLDDGAGPDDPLQILVEVSGEARRDKGVKVMTTATKWCNAVNADGRFGRWTFAELDHIDADTDDTLRTAATDWRDAHVPGDINDSTELQETTA